MAGPSFGRFAEAGLWILVALIEDPRSATALFDEIRLRNGTIGPGTLFGAIARLEAAALIVRGPDVDGSDVYRLTRDDPSR